MSELLTDIQAFCVRHKMAKTRFGELALGDKPFVTQLEGGRRTWPDTEEKIRNFMRDYTPEQQDAA